MKPPGFGALLIQASSWTCRQCLRKQRQSTAPQRFVTQNAKPVRKNGRRRAVLLATGGGTLGAAGFAFSDDVKHGYAAAERTGRLVSTLAVCMNE